MCGYVWFKNKIQGLEKKKLSKKNADLAYEWILLKVWKSSHSINIWQEGLLKWKYAFRAAFSCPASVCLHITAKAQLSVTWKDMLAMCKAAWKGWAYVMNMLSTLCCMYEVRSEYSTPDYSLSSAPTGTDVAPFTTASMSFCQFSPRPLSCQKSIRNKRANSAPYSLYECIIV